MTLGEKIKALRLSKNLTQEELAANKITRNMLSFIERDKANPSLDTLKFLAESLGVSLAFLFSEDDDMFFFDKKAVINEIYLAYENKNYTVAIKMINELSETDDELEFILVCSHFELGKNLLFRGSLISAETNLREALKHTDKTVYKTNTYKSLCLMYIAIAKNIQAPLLEFDINTYENILNSSYDYELFKYLTADMDYVYTDLKLQKHMNAKKHMKDRNFQEAIKELLSAVELYTNEDYNAYVIFGIYIDLENCYKQLYDFENAYRYSTKRLSMIEGFKS